MKRAGEQSVVASVKGALGAARKAARAEEALTRKAAAWIGGLSERARQSALSDPAPVAPPRLPSPAEVLDEARRRASKVGAVTAAVAAWSETATLYSKHRHGDPVTAGDVWRSTRKVGQRAMDASRAANRRYLTIVGIDTTARVVAWQSARRAAASPVWKAIHFTSSRVAGRAGVILMAADVFMAMRSDLDRYKRGELSREDFNRNCALTGVSILAPVVGASAGPLGATAGLAVSIGAGMARR